MSNKRVFDFDFLDLELGGEQHELDIICFKGLEIVVSENHPDDSSVRSVDEIESIINDKQSYRVKQIPTLLRDPVHKKRQSYQNPVQNNDDTSILHEYERTCLKLCDSMRRSDVTRTYVQALVKRQRISTTGFFISSECSQVEQTRVQFRTLLERETSDSSLSCSNGGC